MRSAFPHDHSPKSKRRLDIDGKEVDYGDQIAWCGIATSTGLPSTVVPITKSDGHLPIGVQIIGGFLEDRTTIKFAELFEREFGGFTPPPIPPSGRAVETPHRAHEGRPVSASATARLRSLSHAREPDAGIAMT